MDDITDVMEDVPHGLELQSAILHVLDGKHHNISLSEQTLNLEEPMLEKYVKRYVNRCKNDMRIKPGQFLEASSFEAELRKYFHQDTSLPEFSSAVCRPLIEYFEHDEARSFEVLFADYRYSDIPYIAVVLLEEQETLTAMTDAQNGRILNTIRFGYSALPSVSRPVSCFALVNQITGDIFFVDEGKWKDGYHLLTERFLEAEAGISRKEAVENVKEIACEIAEEFHENPTILLSQVKNYISDTAKEGMPLRPQTLAEEVFEAKPEMKEVFLRKAEEKILPQEVELPRTAVSASMKKQKIKTDTGIEISFPAEYFRNNEYIEFVNHTDGTITIEIKQINKITNKL